MIGVSKLQFYSVGIVAINKPLSTKDIEVTPVENITMSTGELNSNFSSYKANAKDSEGVAYQSDIATTNTIKATWLPINGSNRLTAPDVRRGETVIIYRFADTDEFFWATLKDDSHLRKLETVIYGFSGTTDENAKPSADNMYFLEISTHGKMVHFHTSDKNGEPFKYDIQINTGEGFIRIQDDDSNFIFLDSKNQHIRLENRDQSFLDMNKNNIILKSTESITIETKNLKTKSVNHADECSAYTIKRSSMDIS